MGDQRKRRGGIRNKGTKDRPLWYCRYTDVDGRRREVPTNQPSREGAAAFLAAIKARIARGMVGIPEVTGEEKRRRSITCAELVARFLGDVQGDPGWRPPSLHDVEGYRRRARALFEVRVLPTFGARAAASIKRAEVEAWRDEQLEHLAAGSVVQSLAYASKLFNWGRRVELIDCPNPVQGVEHPPTYPTIDYYDAREVGALLEAAERCGLDDSALANERMRWPLVATAIYAGLRKGELFGLRWTDVHLDGAPRLDVMRSYSLPVPKGGKKRHLPIAPELVPILRAWRERCPATDERLVFPVEVTDGVGQYRMGRAADRLGLPALLKASGCHVPSKPLHACRHTFASHFMMAGGNILTLQKLLGHASIEQTMQYSHLAPDFMAAEVARLHFPRPVAAKVIDLAAVRAAAAALDESERAAEIADV